MTGKHLVVFIHGFEGTDRDFDNAERAFHRFFSAKNRTAETLTTLKVKGNAGIAGTYDGIEKGAVRIWREVMDEIARLGDSLKALSIVGHSLGGLYARYVVRLLDDCFVFEKCEPRVFVTLATPHLSVRRPQTTPLNVVFQQVAKKICATARELCLEDDSKSPLLFRMTQPSFVDVLKKFRRRVLYANVSNDFQVHYSTASISTFNPYNRDASRTKRSTEYPDLTDWSLASVHARLRHENAEEVEAFARSDVYRPFLRQMFERLNSLQWERYDAMFLTVFAHEQIINKRSVFAGREVIRHLLNHVFTEAESRVELPLRRSPSLDNQREEEDGKQATEAVVRLSQLYVSQI